MGVIKLIVLAFVLWAINGCAHSPDPLGASKDSLLLEPSAATALLGNGEAAFKKREYELAIRYFRKLRSEFPKSRSARLAEFRLGSLAYQRREFELAARYFREMLAFSTVAADSGFEQFKVDAAYNLAACEHQLQRYENAYEVLRGIDLSAIAVRRYQRAEMVYALIERVARHLKDGPGLIAALSAHAQLPIARNVALQLEKEIETELAKIDDSAALESLLSGDFIVRARPVLVVHDVVTRSKIRERLRNLAGDFSGGLPEPAGQPVPADSDATLTGLENSRSPRIGSASVGVLLPLTGKFASVGQRALDAILLAAGVFDPKVDSQIKLFVADTMSEEFGVEAVVKGLVEQHNVSVLIGPLSWKESIAVARTAQELEVVNLSLAPREGVSAVGEFVFQNALTAKVQVENLVNYCVSKRGLRRFAILAPNDPFGKDMALQFWNAVEGAGGSIISHETYTPDSTDFQEPIRKLVGLHESEKYRNTELSKIAEYQKELKLKNPKVRDKKFRLQPIVDFDGLFIPDGPKIVSQIIPNLAYFDINNITLLGTAEWVGGQLFRRSGRAVVGSFFPVAINPEPRQPIQFAFINQYRRELGALPDLLAAQAYEAMVIVSHALSAAESHTAVNIAAAISRLKNFDGPLGQFSVDEHRMASRKLLVFTFDTSGGMVEASGASD